MKYLTKKNFFPSQTAGIVFLLCSFLLGLCVSCGAWANNAEIEIIAGGKKFDSFEQYKQSKQEVGLFPALPKIPVKLFVTRLFGLTHNLDGWVIANQWLYGILKRQSSEFAQEQGGPNYGGRSVHQLLQAVSAMSNVGFNTGVIKVINDFQKAGSGAIVYKAINSKDLENVLSEAFPDGGYSGPILVISNKNKVRILTLDSGQTDNREK